MEITNYITLEETEELLSQEQFFQLAHQILKMLLDQWGSLKTNGTYEFQQLPLLEHKGKKYTQSIAIALYLAR